MDYKELIKALVCNNSEDEPDNLGCSNQRCKYRDVDGACDIVKMCTDAAAAITKLLERAEKAESQLSKYSEYGLEPCDYSVMKNIQRRIEDVELQRDMWANLAKERSADCRAMRNKAVAAEERAEKAETKLLYTQECVAALSLLLKAIDGKMRMENILPMARNRLDKYRKRFPSAKIALDEQKEDD